MGKRETKKGEKEGKGTEEPVELEGEGEEESD